jgi:hypothetical protein
MTEETGLARSGLPHWARMALISLCAVLAVFAAGAMAGATAAAREDGLSLATMAMLCLFLALGVGSAWAGWKLYAAIGTEPEAPRVRTSRLMLVLGGAMGAVFGLLMSVGVDATGSGSVFDNSPLPLWLASLAIIGWTVGGSLLTFLWLRSIDEHEMQANNAGALAALCTYLLVEPTWWLGWRGGFLPEQQPMLTFLLVLTVYTAVWFWRRSR